MTQASDCGRGLCRPVNEHGWADALRHGYDKEQLATDLLGLLDALGLGEVGMIGHDWVAGPASSPACVLQNGSAVCSPWASRTRSAIGQAPRGAPFLFGDRVRTAPIKDQRPTVSRSRSHRYP